MKTPAREVQAFNDTGFDQPGLFCFSSPGVRADQKLVCRYPAHFGSWWPLGYFAVRCISGHGGFLFQSRFSYSCGFEDA